jgi:hypothetical protein
MSVNISSYVGNHIVYDVLELSLLKFVHFWETTLVLMLKSYAC